MLVFFANFFSDLFGNFDALFTGNSFTFLDGNFMSNLLGNFGAFLFYDIFTFGIGNFSNGVDAMSFGNLRAFGNDDVSGSFNGSFGANFFNFVVAFGNDFLVVSVRFGGSAVSMVSVSVSIRSISVVVFVGFVSDGFISGNLNDGSSNGNFFANFVDDIGTSFFISGVVSFFGVFGTNFLVNGFAFFIGNGSNGRVAFFAGDIFAFIDVFGVIFGFAQSFASFFVNGGAFGRFDRLIFRVAFGTFFNRRGMIDGNGGYGSDVSGFFNGMGVGGSMGVSVETVSRGAQSQWQETHN